MIGLNTQMARVAEVDRGNFVWWNGKVTRGAYITRMPSPLTAVKPEIAILGADQKERGLWERENMTNIVCLHWLTIDILNYKPL